MHSHSRTGFSLIEVIICVGLVGIMLMPLASMMKASAHAWQDAEAEGGADARLRSSARWAHDTLLRCDGIVDTGKHWIEFQRSGATWRMEIIGGQLRMRAGTQDILIADQVTDLEVAVSRHSATNVILAVDFQLIGNAVGAAAAPQVNTTVTLDPLKQL
ncbi:type IV pilus modification PilV family protein [Roseimaritima ulvae]|uniref:Prepilin-type N-terminal cleavage/methylation domain-containing protein n=1 Tax=Roseimaritima ulvae TaxID=980254 RepID=A0A5B9QWY9_9BACT|nr:prepilin-type N-terminal cleavage/methylation domain-containing protein [Roseimaritima ulvae]QEG43537.1 hypothetical protein UC8_55880 [Roseimaritima ulvae]